MQATPNHTVSHQNGQQHNMQCQSEVSDEAETFLQPTFINILNELSNITERVLLPESAEIEAETEVLSGPQTCMHV